MCAISQMFITSFPNNVTPSPLRRLRINLYWQKAAVKHVLSVVSQYVNVLTNFANSPHVTNYQDASLHSVQFDSNRIRLYEPWNRVSKCEAVLIAKDWVRLWGMLSEIYKHWPMFWRLVSALIMIYIRCERFCINFVLSQFSF